MKLSNLSKILLLLCIVLFASTRSIYADDTDDIDDASAEPVDDLEDEDNEDFDDFDDMDLNVEELIFESPQDIEDLTNKALKDFALKIRKEEGLERSRGYGTICSKDEHCEEHESRHQGWKVPAKELHHTRCLSIWIIDLCSQGGQPYASFGGQNNLKKNGYQTAWQERYILRLFTSARAKLDVSATAYSIKERKRNFR